MSLDFNKINEDIHALNAGLADLAAHPDEGLSPDISRLAEQTLANLRTVDLSTLDDAEPIQAKKLEEEYLSFSKQLQCIPTERKLAKFTLWVLKLLNPEGTLVQQDSTLSTLEEINLQAAALRKQLQMHQLCQDEGGAQKIMDEICEERPTWYGHHEMNKLKYYIGKWGSLDLLVDTLILAKNIRYQEAPRDLREHPRFTLAAVKQDFQNLESLEKFKNNREIILAVVKQNGFSLSYASTELKNDHEIVLAAVKQNGFALHYASTQLQNDPEIVLAAVKQGGGYLSYASARLKNNKEIVLAAVK